MVRDCQTGTVWAYLDGNAAQGPLAGERLAFVPFPQMAWADWRAKQPDTLVLDPETPYKDHYRPVRIGRPNRREVLWGDDRLAANTLEVGVEANGAFVGFPIDVLGREGGVVNTGVGGVPVVVVSDAGSQTGHRLRADSQRPDAGVRQHPQLAVAFGYATRRRDRHGTPVATGWTGPWWASLNFVPSSISEWYGWSGYHAETGLDEGSSH